MDNSIELNTIRVAILMYAKNEKQLHDLQLAEVTRYVLSLKFSWHYHNQIEKNEDPDKIYDFLLDLAFSMITPKQNLN